MERGQLNNIKEQWFIDRDYNTEHPNRFPVIGVAYYHIDQLVKEIESCWEENKLLREKSR